MATPQEVVRNTKYINVIPDMLYKHPEPLKPHPKQPYVPPIVLTDVEYIDLTKPALMAPAEITLAQDYLVGKIEEIVGAPYPKSLVESSALEMKMACNDLLKEVKPGTGKAIGGVGHTRPIRDINRIIAQHGGSVEDWAKMSTKVDHKFNHTGTFYNTEANLELHWYENIKTGKIEEVKPKINISPAGPL